MHLKKMRYPVISSNSTKIALDLLARSVFRKPTELYRLNIILYLREDRLFGKRNCVCPKVRRWSYPPIPVTVHYRHRCEITICFPSGHEKKSLFFFPGLCVPFGMLDNGRRQESQNKSNEVYFWKRLCSLI